MVKAVIFDMDGLMFDTERLWDTLWEPACKELGLPLPPDMAKFQAGGRGLAGDNLRRHVAQYIPCAFGLAAAAPRSPYRHLELCGIAIN